MRIFNLQDLGAFGLTALGLGALSLAHLDAEFAIDLFFYALPQAKLY
jgi:hypothetical protein